MHLERSIRAMGMQPRRFILAQTDIVLFCDQRMGYRAAVRRIRADRAALERYICRVPLFFATIEPLAVVDRAPPLVRRMADAAARAGVGPMAAVAGAIAERAVEAMLESGATAGIAENGGDIQLAGQISGSVRMAVNAPGAALADRLAFRIPPSSLPLGVCTSAGAAGSSISFGTAQAAVAVARSATLADAAATAVANAADGADAEASVQNALECADDIETLRGALVIVDGLVGRTGHLPELLWLEESATLTGRTPQLQEY